MNLLYVDCWVKVYLSSIPEDRLKGSKGNYDLDSNCFTGRGRREVTHGD
jgi:hypothetical protein